MNRLLVAVVVVAGCTDTGEPDVVGPFTGEIHRYVVDRFTLPTSNALAREYGEDLTDDGVVDNELGQITGFLAYDGNLNENAADMVAAGTLASTVELQADELDDDRTVGVSYFGADGDAATVMGGTLDGGVFRSNRTRFTARPGAARVRLPVFVDVDPSVLDLVGLQLDLTPDGQGGFDGKIAGAVIDPGAMVAASKGLSEMFAANPQDHLQLVRSFDMVPHDGVVTPLEVTRSMPTQSVLSPDILVGKAPAMSVGFLIHLTPCPEGRCAAAPPVNRCFDRALDGDEADVDCGGSCALDCIGGKRCLLASDCQSGSCDGGVCRAVSCSDGVLNGFETEIDCGWNCKNCLGGGCSVGSECASGHCDPQSHICIP